MTVSLGGGYGMTTRMPTIDYLFPQVHYSDFVQLGYYDVRHPEEYSRVNLRTYITDPTNYDLRATQPQVGGASWRDMGQEPCVGDIFQRAAQAQASVIRRSMTDMPTAATTRRPSTRRVTGQPSLEGLPYTDRMILDGYSRVTNGTRIDKQGVEAQAHHGALAGAAHGAYGDRGMVPYTLLQLADALQDGQHRGR